MFTDARNCLIMNKLQNGSMEGHTESAERVCEETNLNNNHNFIHK